MEETIKINNKGVELFLNKNLDEAEQEFLKVLVKDDFNITALNNLGLLYHQKGNYEEAVVCYSKAIEIQPKDTYYLNRANSFVFLEKLNEAEEDYKACLRVNPDNVNAKASLARFYEVIKKTESAIHIWEHLVHTSTEDFYKIELAKAYMSIGKYKDALSLFHALNSTNEEILINYYIGVCHFNLKNYGIAEDAFKSCLEVEPNNYNIRHYLAVSYLSKEEFESALTEFDFLTKMYPENLKVKLDKIAVLLNMHDFKKASEIIKSVLAVDPKNEKALYYNKTIDEIDR